MRFVFLGDVHSNLKRCNDVSTKYPSRTIIQVGDFGVGFVSTEIIGRLPKNFYFFPGNHDNRQVALTLSSCLGNYGERFGKFFFVSGADSIDADRRIMGVDMWEDEQLSYKQAEHCLELWEKSKLNVLVSHDCPQSIAQFNCLIYDSTLTRQLLQRMIEVRKPQLLIHGHHHKSSMFQYEGIQVKALGIDEAWELAL
jgi:predicted phosphodiesterase